MTYVSVRVKRRKCAVEQKAAPLFMQVIAGRRAKRIPLDWRLREEEWDERLESVYIPPGTSRERGEFLLSVVEGLEKARSVGKDVISHLEKRMRFTVEDVVEDYLRRSGQTSWGDYADRQADALLREGRPATARHYRSLGRSLGSFLQGRDMPIRDVNKTLVREYEAFLVAKGLAPNTVSFYLRTMRAIWNKAVQDGVAERQPSPFQNVNTRVEKTGKRAVDTAVIGELEGLRPSLSPRLGQALDLFLFCYYARGMAFVDLAYLTVDNIQGDTLVYKRKKTGQEMRVKLLPAMSQLIGRYRRSGGPYLFPVLRTRDAGYCEYESALRLQNLRLKEIGRKVGARLSTYVPRHSWASAAKKRGVSEALISEGMGHTSVKTTRIYIKSFDDPWLDIMNEYVITGKRRSMRMYGGYFP